jgi:DNA mismatch endonuclease (patch repair protein)
MSIHEPSIVCDSKSLLSYASPVFHTAVSGTSQIGVNTKLDSTMKRRRDQRRSTRRLQLDRKTSSRMARIRQMDTAAELTVRRILTALGYRYRVRNRDLPGSPDIANRRHGWAVFVHGCFWHRHRKCLRTTTPKRNRSFWEEKFAANIRRDRRVQRELRNLGITSLVVWECETSKVDKIKNRLTRLLVR